uniref:trace amine-associated receptor 13c-like n=1 Tax=Solea senegalensis TaxID=28829 RepID=UPI001CD82E43|nr:trace amine-associated receptor 13c-like [Solea senegalensis]
METLEEAELCFPHLLNASCKRQLQHLGPTVIIDIILSCISLLTVMLNLLVIISISHFRQLHTTTNLLLLSLAVADLLVGLLLMPGRMILMTGCWFLGSLICGLFNYLTYILTSASIGTVVLISVDRYVAICDPLSYSTKVTHQRVKMSICLCWACSLFYNGVMLHVFLEKPDAHNSCYGECVVVIDFITGAIDLVLTFLGPIAVIVVLYMKVFVVAVSQARAMRSHITTVTVQGSVTVTAKKSVIKAAMILGIVVVVFVICFCPCFYIVLTDTPPSLAFSNFALWLVYCNSCINPVIYASFYPWFRRSIILIVTLQTLQPHSRDSRIMNKC